MRQILHVAQMHRDFEKVMRNASVLKRSDTHLPFLFIHHVELLFTQPGLHLGCVKEVLLSLVHGI